MEFQYRAIDERRRSRSPPPPAAPSTPGSGSADSHHGDVPVERVGNSAAAAAVDADELRRQAEKARIRERILREEAEHWELELEVRSELREEMLHRSWPALGRSARGPDTPEVLSTGTITAANSSLPVVALEVHPKSNALATVPTKRKSPDRATGALLVSSSKKQKRTLTCTVCCITANSEKAMQGHLNGKAHKRKVVALPELPKLVPETEQERGLEAGEEEAMAMETLGDYKPTKFMMATTTGELNEVTQMEYLLCELCNVRTADRVTMMCHLQGSKHISNGQKKCQPSSKPLDETVNAATSAIGSADPKKLVLEDFSEPLPHNVRRLEGFLLCELCDVKAPSMHGMHQHLSGKKHKNKVNASSDASVNVSTGGKVEAPLEKSLQSDDNEVQERTVAPQEEDVATGDSVKTAGTEIMKSSATSTGAQLNNACSSDLLTMEVDGVMHPLSRVDGLFVCLSCNAKAPSETIIRSHLAGKKHKRKITLATQGNNVTTGKKHKHKMTLAAQENNDLSVLVTTGADEVQDNSSKSTKANVEAGSVVSVVPQANTAEDEEESDPSLASPQTKNTVAVASMAVDQPAAAQPNVEAGSVVSVVQQANTAADVEESAPSLVTPQMKNAVAVASMAVDQPAAAQLDTCVVGPTEDCEITEEAKGMHAVACSNGSVAQTKESVRTNDTTPPGKPIKIQVEGKVFTVMQQESGSLSCEVCGVHGCDKDSMIQHLYTSTHWGKSSLVEKREASEGSGGLLRSGNDVSVCDHI